MAAGGSPCLTSTVACPPVAFSFALLWLLACSVSFANGASGSPNECSSIGSAECSIACAAAQPVISSFGVRSPGTAMVSNLSRAACPSSISGILRAESMTASSFLDRDSLAVLPQGLADSAATGCTRLMIIQKLNGTIDLDLQSASLNVSQTTVCRWLLISPKDSVSGPTGVVVNVLTFKATDTISPTPLLTLTNGHNRIQSNTLYTASQSLMAPAVVFHPTSQAVLVTMDVSSLAPSARASAALRLSYTFAPSTQFCQLGGLRVSGDQGDLSLRVPLNNATSESCSLTMDSSSAASRTTSTISPRLSVRVAVQFTVLNTKGASSAVRIIDPISQEVLSEVSPSTLLSTKYANDADAVRPGFVLSTSLQAISMRSALQLSIPSCGDGCGFITSIQVRFFIEAPNFYCQPDADVFSSARLVSSGVSSPACLASFPALSAFQSDGSVLITTKYYSSSSSVGSLSLYSIPSGVCLQTTRASSAGISSAVFFLPETRSVLRMSNPNLTDYHISTIVNQTTVSSVSPVLIPAYRSSSLTINGTKFNSDIRVWFGDSEASVTSVDTVTGSAVVQTPLVTLSSNDSLLPLTVDVSRGGSASVSSARTGLSDVKVFAFSAPNITQVTSSSSAAGADLLVIGSNFFNATAFDPTYLQCSFNATYRTLARFINSTAITCQSPSTTNLIGQTVTVAPTGLFILQVISNGQLADRSPSFAILKVIGCSPGTFSASGSPPCTDCPIGTFTASFGSVACQACPQGQITNQTGSLQCTQCPPGSATFGSGSLCSSCPANTYQPAYGTDQCIGCPQNSESVVATNSTSPADCFCLAGFWRDTPDEAVCVPCLPPAACRATRDFGAGICAEGYQGRRCGLCDSGYYRLQERCVSCPRIEPFVWALFVFIVCAALLAAVFLPRSPTGRLVGSVVSKMNLLNFFSLIVDRCQILAIILTIRFHWPANIAEVFSFLSAISLNLDFLVAPECAIRVTYFTKYLLYILSPLIAFAAISLLSIVVDLVTSRKTGVFSFKTLTSSTRGFVWVYFLLLSPLLQKSMDFQRCSPVGDKMYWELDSSILCDASADNEFFGIDLFGKLGLIVYCALVPLFLLICTRVESLHGVVAGVLEEYKSGVGGSTITRLFVRNYFFLDFLRRFFFVLIVTLARDSPMVAGGTMLLLVILYCASIILLRPYRSLAKEDLDSTSTLLRDHNIQLGLSCALHFIALVSGLAIGERDPTGSTSVAGYFLLSAFFLLLTLSLPLILWLPDTWLQKRSVFSLAFLCGSCCGCYRSNRYLAIRILPVMFFLGLAALVASVTVDLDALEPALFVSSLGVVLGSLLFGLLHGCFVARDQRLQCRDIVSCLRCSQVSEEIQDLPQPDNSKSDLDLFSCLSCFRNDSRQQEGVQLEQSSSAKELGIELSAPSNAASFGTQGEMN